MRAFALTKRWGELRATYSIQQSSRTAYRILPDPRSLQATDLCALVKGNENLDVSQKTSFELLNKFLGNMQSKPGRCNLFEYKFQVSEDILIVGYSLTLLLYALQLVTTLRIFCILCNAKQIISACLRVID
jgi:hypothetical protein